MSATSADLAAETYLKNSASSGQPVFVFAAPTVAATYTLTVYACKTSVDSDYKEHCYSYGSGTVSLAIDQRNAGELTIANFTAVDASLMDSGTGNVSLGLSWDTALGVSTVSVAVTATGSSSPVTGFTAGAVSNNSCTISATGIASGTYIMTMTFTGSSGNTIAVSNGVQVITVCAGCTTNKWYDDTDTSAAGTAALTITAASAQKVFYVCGTSPSVYGTGNSITTAAASSDSNDGTLLKPLATVQAAVAKVNTANDGTSTYTICVDGTFTDDASKDRSGTNNAMVNIAPSKNLTLILAGMDDETPAVFDAGRSAGSPATYARVMCVVGTDHTVSVSVRNISFKNGHLSASESQYGAGICINDASFSMLRGSISDNAGIGGSANHGGGLYFYTQSSCTLALDSVTIENNSIGGASYTEGGGIVISGGNSNIKNCSIKNNSLSGSSDLHGGNVSVSGTAVFTDCTIDGFAGGTSNKPAEVNVSFYGAGIYVSGITSDVTVNGTSYIKNMNLTSKSPTVYGSAIYVADGTVSLKGNTEISGNTFTGTNASSYCSAVYVSTGRVEMSEHACITGNTDANTITLQVYGGGVYINGGEFIMNSASAVISENAAESNKEPAGGGVYVASGTFTLTAGTVTKNNCTGSSNYNGTGGGIYAASGTVTIGTAACITENTLTYGTTGKNVYLKTGVRFTGTISSTSYTGTPLASDVSM
jgi:hypothetical protein